MTRLLAVLFFCASLFAQDNILFEADSLFHAGDYERVELLVLRAERQFDLPDSQMVSLELLGGYSLIMLDRVEEARSHFQRVLELDSTTTLDPVLVSPKFRIVFDEVKVSYLSNRAQEIPAREQMYGTLRVGASPESRVMNLIVPGTGFISEGKPVRGAVHFVLQGVAAALWLSELSQTSDARDKYLAADSANVARLYDDYDSHHQKMWAYGLTTAGVYMLSQLDLALFRRSETLKLYPTPTGATLSLRF